MRKKGLFFKAASVSSMMIASTLLLSPAVVAQTVVANTLQATWSGTTTTSGSYVFWNLSGGQGEADFVNNDGGGWLGGYVFYNTPPSGSPLTSLLRITGGGNAGFQTDSPLNVVSVSGGLNVDDNDDNPGYPWYQFNSAILGLSFGHYSGEGISSARVAGSPNFYGLDFFTDYNNRMSITNGGNVGIGTANPGADLSSVANPPASGLPIFDVQGHIELGQGSGGGIYFQDGTFQNTAFNPANCGADYAESVDVTGDRTNYAPGDVLVLDPAEPGKFLKSNQPYSTMVSGIYSTKPGFVGRLHPRNPVAEPAEVPMAMVGRVPTKVSAENGPIKVGDLLVTSSTMGYAMKGTDRSQMLGSVVGKAMGSLDSGTGVILVLVTLQ